MPGGSPAAPLLGEFGRLLSLIRAAGKQWATRPPRSRHASQEHQVKLTSLQVSHSAKLSPTGCFAGWINCRRKPGFVSVEGRAVVRQKKGRRKGRRSSNLLDRSET